MAKHLKHREWFDAEKHPYCNTDDGERLAYHGLVVQCRYSEVEVPDDLWVHAGSCWKAVR